MNKALEKWLANEWKRCIDIPMGYRLLTEKDKFENGDMYWQETVKEWDTVGRWDFGYKPHEGVRAIRKNKI